MAEWGLSSLRGCPTAAVFPQSSGESSRPSALSSAGRIQPCKCRGSRAQEAPTVTHTAWGTACLGMGGGGDPQLPQPHMRVPPPHHARHPWAGGCARTRPPASPSCGLFKAVEQPLSTGGFWGLSSAQEACECLARDGFAGNREKNPNPKAGGWMPSLLNCLAEPTAPLPPGHTYSGSSPKSVPLCPLPAQGPCPRPGTAFSLHPQL